MAVWSRRECMLNGRCGRVTVQLRLECACGPGGGVRLCSSGGSVVVWLNLECACVAEVGVHAVWLRWDCGRVAEVGVWL